MATRARRRTTTTTSCQIWTSTSRSSTTSRRASPTARPLLARNTTSCAQPWTSAARKVRSLNGFNPTANASNPHLEPLESDNIDLSVEWYFADASYLSAGFFHKKVANFIGHEVAHAKACSVSPIKPAARVPRQQ